MLCIWCYKRKKLTLRMTIFYLETPMTWTNSARDFLFFNEVDGEDTWFQTHYCAKRTLERLQSDYKNQIPFETIRRTIARITEIVPYGEHSTPGWNAPGPWPLIVVGCGGLQDRQSRWTLVIKKPRFGLCIHEEKIYIWSDKETIKKYFPDDKISINSWHLWRGKKEDANNVQRYAISVEITSEKIQKDHPLHKDSILTSFLEKIGENIRKPDEKLGIVLAAARNNLDEPQELSAIYPKLLDEENIDDNISSSLEETEIQKPTNTNTSSRLINTEENIKTKAEQAHENLSQNKEISKSNSMLQIIRDLALARIRTANPRFNEIDLNNWIMATGYEDAINPEKDLADLFHVFSASLTNAGGQKPKTDVFGKTIGCIMQPNDQPHETKPQTIQELGNKILSQLQEKNLTLGGGFDDRIRLISEGRNGGPVMTGLLNGILEFEAWIKKEYANSAQNLNIAMIKYIAEDENPSPKVFEILRTLKRFSWMGIATAANFIKDSQIPSLNKERIVPTSAARYLAGWFVKPDLHVSRLMAYITGRHDNTMPQLQSFNQTEILKKFINGPHKNFNGIYNNITRGDSLEFRVIADVHEWATATHTSPLEIDRLLYLIGVKETKINGIKIHAPWYSIFTKEIDAAIQRNVSRKS